MDAQAFRGVVYSIGLVAIVSVGGIVVALALEHDPPAILTHIASTSVGVLIGLAVNPTGSRSANPGSTGEIVGVTKASPGP